MYVSNSSFLRDPRLSFSAPPVRLMVDLVSNLFTTKEVPWLHHQNRTGDLWSTGFERPYGKCITAEDPSYDDARQVSLRSSRGGRSPSRGSLGPATVAAAVNAGQRWCPRARRPSGSTSPGYGTVDDGLVIDLSRMDEVEIDADPGTAWAGNGVTAGKYMLATLRRECCEPDLATPARSASAGSPGRVGWVPGAKERADDREPARGRDRDRRRARSSSGQRAILSLTCSGPSGAARELRRRDAVRAAPARDLTDRRRHDGPCRQRRRSSPASSRPCRQRRRSSPRSLPWLAPPPPLVPERCMASRPRWVIPYVGPVEHGEQAHGPFRALAEPLADNARGHRMM